MNITPDKRYEQVAKIAGVLPDPEELGKKEVHVSATLTQNEKVVKLYNPMVRLRACDHLNKAFRGIIPSQMAEEYWRKRDDLRERGARDAREGKDATAFRDAFHVLGIPRWRPNDPTIYADLYTEYKLAYNAEKETLLLKAKALHWFAEFSEGVMGSVPKPSPSVVNALIGAIEQWLKEPTRTAS